MNRRALRLGAVIGATALTALAIAPAFAATTVVSQATSSAITLSIAGNNAYSGEVSATNDGTKETKTGEAQPPIGVLGNQNIANIGALVQDATAKVSNKNGTSAACAGVAGNGGTTAVLANVGDSSCITPGAPVTLSLANLDLSGVITIDPKSALGPLAALNPALAQILGAITKPLADAVASTPLGQTGLAGSLGAIEARCTAVPGKAEGFANIVDSKLMLNVAGTEVVLVNLPAHPAPNTHLLTNLDKVTAAVLAAVRTQLETMLANGVAGPLAPLAVLPQALQDQVITTLVQALQPLLKPLEDNVLDVTLNKQTMTGTDKIDVTALSLKLLPAAQQFGAGPLLDAEIGHVSCGPNDRVDDGVTPPPAPNPNPAPPNGGPVSGPGGIPTSVDSGLGGNGNTAAILTGTAALMLLAGSAGLIGYRRMLLK